MALRGVGPERPGEVVHGLRAGLAVIERRPGDVLAVACSAAVRSEVSAALARARPAEVPLAVEPEEQLSRRAGNKHHEGLVLEVRARRFFAISDLGDLLLARSGAAVALDRVRNPYNVGAILRTAAFFGVDAALLGAPAPHPALHPDAVRVAEGGAEHLALARTTDLAATLGRLRERGVTVIGAESKGGEDAARFPFQRPTVLVLGHEREGLSARVRAECSALVCVRGRGGLDSLNVSVAAGVLAAALTAAPADRRLP